METSLSLESILVRSCLEDEGKCLLQWRNCAGLRSLFSIGRNHWEGDGEAKPIPANLVLWSAPSWEGRYEEIRTRKCSRVDPVTTTPHF